MSDEPRPSWWKRTNWWKFAFFTLLLIFEVTRELYVLELNSQARPNGWLQVSDYGDRIVAEGSWKRTDNEDDPLLPQTVSIQCMRERQECWEISTLMNQRYVYSPGISLFPATFESDGVTYENADPRCATYTVRIDTRLEKVIAVRQRKESPVAAGCEKLEQRIEMTLVGGAQQQAFKDPFKDHFLPVLQILVGIFGWFQKY